MSKLKNLIDRLCPDGVPFKPLGELCEILDSQRKPVAKGKRSSGSYPYYGANGIQDYVDNFIFDGTFLLVGEDGSVINPDKSPILNWAVGKIWVNNHAHILKETEGIMLRYLYYALQVTDVSDIVRGTPPKLNQANLRNLIIPVPPLEVQEEIVRILDTFSAHAAELQAELQARKEQYEYYRNLLLTFNPSACGCGTDGEQKIKDVNTSPTGSYKIHWKTMGEVCKISRGVRVVKNDLMASGSIPVYQNSLTPLGYHNEPNCNGDITFIIGGGAAGDIGYSPVPFWAADDCFPILCGDSVISKYIYHYLLINQVKIKSWVRKASIPRLSRQPLEKMLIPIPPIELQEKIVDILDRFETLVNNLTTGLPAEIAAVKEQYEYYRNKLLTFKQIPA